MITDKQINDILSKIVNNFEPEKVIMFGSYATGNYGEDSDLDLLIVKDTELPRHKRNIEIRRALIGTKVPLDLLVYTSGEFNSEKNSKYSFLNSIIDEAKVLYER